MSDDPRFDFCAGQDALFSPVNIRNLRGYVVGVNQRVPLVDGRRVPYVNFDNAATTPPFTLVLDCSRRFFEWYASVHRGSGFKSLLSTHIYDRCREVVAGFVGADLSHHTVIFCQNATHALNKLATRVCVGEGHRVIATLMEHHSNMLPWRRLGCTVEYVRVHPADGSLDLADLENRLTSGGRVCLVTVSGASNVTGCRPPIRRIARLAHRHGALVAVDGSQLVPHRPVDMGDPDDPERIDFLAFSAHKMYAPFGSGVLIGPRAIFDEGDPDTVGGGTVNAVTIEEVVWSAPPAKEEAGTPNAPGAIALASAIRVLQTVGMDAITEHEHELTRRALEKLTRLDGITLYGLRDPALTRDRLGVIPLNVDGMHHSQLAAMLGHEWGIGVRNGCFCAHPYLRELLGIPAEEILRVARNAAAGRRRELPGMVRASFGCYNTVDEIDYLVDALRAAILDGPAANYIFDDQHGEYVPDPPVVSLDGYAPF
jgi:selenocysteine lyase/cysteine desulfurase